METFIFQQSHVYICKSFYIQCSRNIWVCKFREIWKRRRKKNRYVGIRNPFLKEWSLSYFFKLASKHLGNRCAYDTESNHYKRFFDLNKKRNYKLKRNKQQCNNGLVVKKQQQIWENRTFPKNLPKSVCR